MQWTICPLQKRRRREATFVSSGQLGHLIAMRSPMQTTTCRLQNCFGGEAVGYIVASLATSC